MEIKGSRYSDNGNSTLGLFIIDDKFECYMLEDEFREVKVKGKTRIPSGRYEIKKREVISPMTEKYRKQFSWFDWHLEVTGVPGFKYVYIHKGNTEDHTDGCLIVGDTVNNNQLERGFTGKSTQAFERIYKKISKALESERVFIKV